MSETDSEAAPSRAGGWVERETQQDKKEKKHTTTAWCSTQNTTNSKVSEKDDSR